jgi:serine O-acetyltransferase
MVYCRRIEAKKNASTGIGLPDFCCHIADRVYLPHGLNGIIIARNCRIGKNVSVFQHVTIAESNKHKTTIIEDGVMLGAGAVILNNVHIGKGAKIGANAVVTCDVPDYATAIGVPAKIIEKS